jgi:hypothetical protein
MSICGWLLCFVAEEEGHGRFGVAVSPLFIASEVVGTRPRPTASPATTWCGGTGLSPCGTRPLRACAPWMI